MRFVMIPYGQDMVDNILRGSIQDIGYRFAEQVLSRTTQKRFRLIIDKDKTPPQIDLALGTTA